jgi:hypothetical protein
MGRTAPTDLGVLVVREWQATRSHKFGGDINSMPTYVNHFLSALRADFPSIIVDDLGVLRRRELAAAGTVIPCCWC